MAPLGHQERRRALRIDRLDIPRALVPLSFSCPVFAWLSRQKRKIHEPSLKMKEKEKRGSLGPKNKSKKGRRNTRKRRSLGPHRYVPKTSQRKKKIALSWPTGMYQKQVKERKKRYIKRQLSLLACSMYQKQVKGKRETLSLGLTYRYVPKTSHLILNIDQSTDSISQGYK